MRFFVVSLLLLSLQGLGQKAFTVALGTGYAIKEGKKVDNTPAIDLQASYQVDRMNFSYVQGIGVGPANPKFFKALIGVRLGYNVLVIPYTGYSYKVASADGKGTVENGAVFGAQLNIPFRTPGILSQYFYLDANKSNRFYIFSFGIKGPLSFKNL